MKRFLLIALILVVGCNDALLVEWDYPHAYYDVVDGQLVCFNNDDRYYEIVPSMNAEFEVCEWYCAHQDWEPELDPGHIWAKRYVGTDHVAAETARCGD